MATDDSGNGFDGAITGNVQSAAGVCGNAFLFDGDNDFVTVAGDDLGMIQGRIRTVSVWAKPTALAVDGVGAIISKYRHFVPGNSDFYLRLQTDLGGDPIIVITGNGIDFDVFTEGELNEWNHIVYEMQAGAGNSKVYLNGNLLGTATLTYNAVVSTEPLRIGTILGAQNQNFEGFLDEVRIYDRILTQDEIDALGSCGASGFLLIDEESISKDGEPNSFSEVDVNEDIAQIGLRTQLPFFAANVGETITLHTGEVGDEGWFALKAVPDS